MLKQIYHKKNEYFDVEFFENEECTKPFDILTTNVRHLYIELKNGDVTPLIQLDADPSHIKVYTGYCLIIGLVITLNNITLNLSKYIPEDNAVLFLSEEDCDDYKNSITQRSIFYKNANNSLETSYGLTGDLALKELDHLYRKNFTIFLQHGTQASLKKVSKVAKELKEKYGFEKINLFVLHCFNYVYRNSMGSIFIRYYDGEKNHEPITLININKIITTNSTGILKPQNTQYLQVIDCKEIFEEYLKENN